MKSYIPLSLSLTIFAQLADKDKLMNLQLKQTSPNVMMKNKHLTKLLCFTQYEKL
jgi:hypothetical protein